MTLLKLFKRDEPVRTDYTPFEQEVAAALKGMEAYARGHGGTLTLVSAQPAGEVRIRLGGTCRGCPLSSQTLQQGVEAHLRETFPGVRVFPAD